MFLLVYQYIQYMSIFNNAIKLLFNIQFTQNIRIKDPFKTISTLICCVAFSIFIIYNAICIIHKYIIQFFHLHWTPPLDKAQLVKV